MPIATRRKSSRTLLNPSKKASIIKNDDSKSSTQSVTDSLVADVGALPLISERPRVDLTYNPASEASVAESNGERSGARKRKVNGNAKGKKGARSIATEAETNGISTPHDDYPSNETVVEKEGENSTPRKGRQKRASRGFKLEEGEEVGLAPTVEEPAKATKKRKAADRVSVGASRVRKDEESNEDYCASATPPDLDSEGEEMRRDKNGRKLGRNSRKSKKEPKVYEIPPVPRRDFRFEGPPDKRAERAKGFTGSLGYACLNTILRSQDPPKFCSRTVRIKTIEEKGLEWVFDLARRNVKDIIPLLEWNYAHGIHLMRLSSEIFPFASHEKYGYDISFAAAELREAGDVAKKLNQRLTMHPGQFCQLGTPKENVLQASIRELEVHAKVLDLMGIGPDGVMILHGGGTYGDQKTTIERIRHTIEHRLPPNVRSRLVLENDEMSYSVDELLPLCESLNPVVPLIFDFHHDALRPSALEPREIIPRVEALFQKRNITPKYHLSEPRPGARNLRERRAHSDRCAELPEDLPANAHIMLECKDKEQGVLEMMRIYNLREVPHESLRPPADDLTTATGGRRSKLDGSGGSANRKSDENDEKSKAMRAIGKAKAVALKRGLPYEGPKTDAELADAKSSLMSAQEVKDDMKKQAAWIRAELRAGRERRPFPGTALDHEGPEPDEGVLVA